LTIREWRPSTNRTASERSREFLTAASDAMLIRDLDPKATDLEGYLFPETYALARTTPASRLIRDDGGAVPRDVHRPRSRSL
jgi:cell division protein YceG involved in septum cleavage